MNVKFDHTQENFFDTFITEEERDDANAKATKIINDAGDRLSVMLKGIIESEDLKDNQKLYLFIKFGSSLVRMDIYEMVSKIAGKGIAREILGISNFDKN